MENTQTATQRFIEKAIAGGWLPKGYPVLGNIEPGFQSVITWLNGNYERVLLNVDAWEAVGRMAGYSPYATSLRW